MKKRYSLLILIVAAFLMLFSSCDMFSFGDEENNKYSGGAYSGAASELELHKKVYKYGNAGIMEILDAYHKGEEITGLDVIARSGKNEFYLDNCTYGPYDITSGNIIEYVEGNNPFYRQIRISFAYEGDNHSLSYTVQYVDGEVQYVGGIVIDMFNYYTYAELAEDD